MSAIACALLLCGCSAAAIVHKYPGTACRSTWMSENKSCASTEAEVWENAVWTYNCIHRIRTWLTTQGDRRYILWCTGICNLKPRLSCPQVWRKYAPYNFGETAFEALANSISIPYISWAKVGKVTPYKSSKLGDATNSVLTVFPWVHVFHTKLIWLTTLQLNAIFLGRWYHTIAWFR